MKGHIKIHLLLIVFFIFGLSLSAQNNDEENLNVSTLADYTVVAYNDFAIVNESQTVSVNVLNNDLGLNNGVGSLAIDTEPQHGIVSVNEDNTIQYTPEPGYHGTDQFIYQVCNTNGSCDVARVDVRIEDVDYVPVAVNDTVVYKHGTDPVYNILENDTIIGDFPFTVSIMQDFTEGESYLNENNELVPVFPRNFGGIDSLQYSLCDADNDCDEAWVFIDVQYDGESDFYIPNGFSPNGDGFNDTFYVPDFRMFTNMQLTVFNEWGQTVYSNSNYQNNWDGAANTGSLKGKPVPSGTYYYVFTISGISKPLTGYIYLSR
nr:gliding motility-associated C-terminal domain-containing protein [uncultured Carboxylicivirga sp.]